MAILELITLVVSTAVLSKSSSMVVENAVKLASFFRVRTLAIGMLLVALSTSLPELSVSTISSAAGQGAIAAGNVFGSNIANVLLILGTCAFIYGFKVGKENLRDIVLVLALTTIISVYIMFRSLIFGSALGAYEGILLLMIAAWYAWRILSKNRVEEEKQDKPAGKKEAFMCFVLFFVGILLVIVSSSFVVESAVKLADMLGLAKSFIGATLIAIGTSLPELTIELQAIRKKQYGLALGDALGSNVVNITLVLGAAAIINPISVQLSVFVAALLFAVAANMVFLYIAVTKKKFEKNDGAAMLLLYALYLIVVFYLQFGETGLQLPA